MWQRFGDSKGWPDVKRTLEWCIEETQSMIDIARSDDRIIYHKQTTIDKDYTRDAYYQACQHFKESKELSWLRRKLADIIESRVNEKGFFKEADSKIVTLNLTQHYWREDKKTVQQTNIEIDPTRERLNELDG